MRVGVAIPSYQAARYIGDTLRSLTAQSHTDWFCVVVNDGEDDGTSTVVQSINDPRIRYVHDGIHRGQLRAFNRAIILALAREPDVVRLLSADDVLYPHDLAEMVRVLREHPTVGLVATYFDTIDQDGRLVFRVDMRGRGDRIMRGREYLVKGVAVGNTIGGPSSVAIRREAFVSAGLFDTRLDYNGDSDLWHRVAAAWDVAWIGPRVGLQYRVHTGSVTSRDQFAPGKFSDTIQIVRRVAATEVLFGPRWWVHQYTIGRLHAINLQVIVGMARKGHWHGVRTGLRASLREGVLFYSPFWIPRIPYQIVRRLLGLPVSRRLLWRKVHESLQPHFIPVNPPVDPVVERRSAPSHGAHAVQR
jgi:glycosyltransferase involved in cell wall biosynthesis